MSASSISSPSTAGTGSCHSCGSAIHGPRIAADRTHVAVQQLVPGLGERLVELLRVVEPAPGDLGVDRIKPHREVGDQHRRLARRAAEWIRDGRLGVLGLELPCTGGALGQLPLVAVQDLQVGVAPLGRRVRPHHLETAGDRVAGLSRAERALPAQALLLDRGRLGLRPDAVVRSPAPWVLPSVWPPTISAAVSSSFIAIRPNVSRMSMAAASGSGLPSGPSGFT